MGNDTKFPAAEKFGWPEIHKKNQQSIEFSVLKPRYPVWHCLLRSDALLGGGHLITGGVGADTLETRAD